MNRYNQEKIKEIFEREGLSYYYELTPSRLMVTLLGLKIFRDITEGHIYLRLPKTFLGIPYSKKIKIGELDFPFPIPLRNGEVSYGHPRLELIDSHNILGVSSNVHNHSKLKVHLNNSKDISIPIGELEKRVFREKIEVSFEESQNARDYGGSL